MSGAENSQSRNVFHQASFTGVAGLEPSPSRVRTSGKSGKKNRGDRLVRLSQIQEHQVSLLETDKSEPSSWRRIAVASEMRWYEDVEIMIHPSTCCVTKQKHVTSTSTRNHMWSPKWRSQLGELEAAGRKKDTFRCWYSWRRWWVPKAL